MMCFMLTLDSTDKHLEFATNHQLNPVIEKLSSEPPIHTDALTHWMFLSEK